MKNKTADKHSKLYYRTIKMKSDDIKLCTYIDYGVEHNDEYPKSRLLTTLEYPNTKFFFAKNTFQIGLK